MLIKKFFTQHVIVSIFLGLSFFKIYQHNLVIKLNYEKQRLVKRKEHLKKERNDLLMKLFVAQDYGQLQARARQEWGMVPMKVSHVLTLTTQATVDFMATSSRDSVLMQLRLFDCIKKAPGANHACS